MFSKRSSILLFLSLILCSQITMAADCGKCQNCKTINSKNECIQCVDGYRLDPTSSSCIKTQMTSLPGSIRQSSGFTSSTTEITRSSSSSNAAGLNFDPNCDIIESNGICRKCVDRFFLNSATKRCQAVSPFCKEWSSKGKCLSCVTGYSLNLDSKCVPAAQNQNSKNKNIIDQRLEDILKLDNGSTITNKDDAFKLINKFGSLQGSTSQSQVSTSRSQTITTRSNSSSGAASNSNEGNSLSQVSLNTLLNNIPITSTQRSLVVSTIIDNPNNIKLQQVRRPDPLASAINFDFSKFTGEIFTVDPFCEKYQGRVCRNCQLRYVMIQGRCQRVSNTCSEWDPTGKCTVCYSGFNLNGKGQCVRFIIDQSSSSFQGAVKIDGMPSNTSSTTTTTTTSSTIRTTETQQEKTPGVIASISLGPQIVRPAVQNCDQSGENGLCVRCKFRFYNQNGVCKAVSQLCSAWSLTTGACTECYEGFQVSGTTCQKIQPKKQQIPVADPNQLSAEDQFQQFMARFRKKIEQQNQMPVPNCALSKKGNCEICAIRYYNMNGICMAVSDLCNTYNQKTGECTSCKDGFILSDINKGVCNPRLRVPVPFIPTSYGLPNNEDLAQVNKKAQEVKFQTYSSFQTANRVLDDLNQIQLKQAQMQQLQQLQNQIPNFNKFVDNNIIGCQQIGVSGLCTRCAFRYVKLNGGCEQVSDLCKSWNLVNGGCTQCYDGYSLKELYCVPSKNIRRI